MMQLYLAACAYGFLSGMGVTAIYQGERFARESLGTWTTSSLSLMAVLIVNLTWPLP